METIPSEAVLLQSGGSAGHSGEGSMEAFDSRHDASLWHPEPYPSRVRVAVPSGVGKSVGKRWISVGKRSVNTYEKRMQKFVLENVHVPIDSILHSKSWLSSEFRFVRSGDRVFQVVCDSILNDLVHHSVNDLWFHWQGISKFWEDPDWIKVNGARYDLGTSVSLADEFLSYQIGPSNEAKK
jgi:hypothetical protein